MAIRTAKLRRRSGFQWDHHVGLDFHVRRVAAANGGLDVEMPTGEFLRPHQPLPAIKEGNVSVATIDDKVRRSGAWPCGLAGLTGEQTDLSIPRYNLQGRNVALQVATRSMLLLKNGRPTSSTQQRQYQIRCVIGELLSRGPRWRRQRRVQPFAAVSFSAGLR